MRWGSAWRRLAMAAPTSMRGCGCSSSWTCARTRWARATARSSSPRGSRRGTSSPDGAPCGSCSGRRRAPPPPPAPPRKRQRRRPRDDAVRVAGTAGGLELDDVLRRRALLTLHDVELDALALGQGLEALRLDRGVMHEAVLFAVLGRDEAEAFRVVEPLYDTGDACHLL